MTATEIMAMQAKEGGYRIKNSWNGTWNNFTEADVQADCADAANPEKCMETLRNSPNYEGGKSGQWKEVGLGLLSGLFSTIGQNQGGGIMGGAPTISQAELIRREEERRRRQRNTLIGIGVAVVVIGAGIYFYTKNKK